MITISEAPRTATRSSVTPDLSEGGYEARVRELGPAFAARAMNHDETDSFVADNFADLKKARLFSAGIPSELGGGDASYEEMCQLLRMLAGYCGSTALALSMHTHLIAVPAWPRSAVEAPTAVAATAAGWGGLVARLVPQSVRFP